MMNVTIDYLENRAAERAQAAGLVRLVRNFEAKGYEMSVNAKGEIRGIRRGSMIKGQRADYSKSLSTGRKIHHTNRRRQSNRYGSLNLVLQSSIFRAR